MKAFKSKLERLTSAQIERITARAEKSKKVRLVSSKQVNMRIDDQTFMGSL